MHILEIPSFFPPLGGLFCLDQAKALQARGHEVRILSNVQLGISLRWQDFLMLPYRRYEHDMGGITVYQSYQRGIPKVVRPNVNRWIHIVCSMFEDYVNKYGKPDILHAHCAKWAGYAAMKLSQAYGIPYVITEHLSLLLFEEEFGKAPTDAWQVPLLRKAYEEAGCVVTVSDEWTDSVSCYYGTDFRRQYISNIVDTNFFHYKQRSVRKGRHFRFCCMANNIPLKGYDVLLAAFESMRHCEVELHVAGFNTDNSNMKALVARLCRKSAARVKLYGRIDKEAVRSMLHDCDALVLASRSEVQPLVILEALSTGIPVVATEVVPKCERVKGGISIVPVDDVKALATAMDTLIDHYPDDCRLLSQRVADMASPEVIGRQLEALFLELHHQCSEH